MLTDLDFELEPLFPYRISSTFIEWISPTGIYPPKRIGLCIPPPSLRWYSAKSSKYDSLVFAEETGSHYLFIHDNVPSSVQHEFHIFSVSGTGDVDEVVLHFAVSAREAVPEQLIEVLDAGVEVFSGAGIILEGALVRNVTAHDFFLEEIPFV